MFAFYVRVLLCLATVSHSATLFCDDLVRHLDHVEFHHLAGKWALVAGSLADPTHEESFKRTNSASINIVNETSSISLKRAFSLEDSCQYTNLNITLEGSGFSFQEYNMTVALLYTSCPDCVVMSFHKSKTIMRLYLFSRRRDVTQEEAEEFRAQSKCLSMLPPIMKDPSEELCPEKISSDASGQNEDGQGQKP